MGVAEIVVALLGLVSAVAPGVLSALSGKGTDAEAIEAARAAVASLHPVRVGAHADARRAEILAEGGLAPPRPAAVPDLPQPRLVPQVDRRVLERLLGRSDLGHEERAAIRGLLGRAPEGA